MAWINSVLPFGFKHVFYLLQSKLPSGALLGAWPPKQATFGKEEHLEPLDFLWSI